MTSELKTSASLRITDGKGFLVALGNGLTISVQIGRGNYCENYKFVAGEGADTLPASSTAEIALWDSAGDWFDDFDGDEVKGYVPIDDVLRFIEFLRSLPDGLTIPEVKIACRAFSWPA